MREMIDSRAALIHVSDERSMKTININFMLCLWIQVSRQSNLVESFSGSQSSPALLSSQDSPSLSSLYLGLKAVQPCWVVKTVHPCPVFIWVSKQSSPAEWSRQFIPVECLSGPQSSPALLSDQDNPSLSSLYLGFKAVQLCWVVKTVYPCRVLVWGSI